MAELKRDLIDSLTRRANRCADGDFAAVLEPAAVSEADALRACSQRPVGIAGAEAIEPDACVVLAMFHWLRYQVLPEGEDAADLQRALQLFEAVAEYAPDWVPDEARPLLPDRASERRAARLHMVLREASTLYEQAKESRDPGKFDQAVQLLNDAIDELDEDDELRPPAMSALVHLVTERVKWTGSSLPSENDPVIAEYHRCHDRALELIEAAEDDVAAVEAEALLRQAVALPVGGAGAAVPIANLSILLHRRYKAEGRVEDLTEAIELARRAREFSGEDDPSCADGLGVVLQSEFERSGKLAVLDEAISLLRFAAGTAREGDPERPKYLGNLSNALRSRYEVIFDVESLEEALVAGREAVRASLPDDPGRSVRLNNLAGALLCQYERNADPALLTEAIDVLRQPQQGTAELVNLAGALSRLFAQTGDLGLLTEAEAALNEALPALPSGHPRRADILGSLRRIRVLEYRWYGNSEALRDAADYQRAAVRAAADAGIDQASDLINLADVLIDLYERAGDSSTAGEAAEAAVLAVGAAPLGHPLYSAAMTRLGLVLSATEAETENKDSSAGVVDLFRSAVKRSAPDDPARITRLLHLSTALHRRYQRTHDLQHLAEAVDTAQTAVDASPLGDPYRYQSLRVLGRVLHALHLATSDGESLERADAAWQAAALSVHAPLDERIHILRECGYLAGARGDWQRAARAYEQAVDLLPMLTPRHMARDDQEHQLRSTIGLADQAARAALHAGSGPAHAVELLERGRGILLGHAVRLPDEVERLGQVSPELAERLTYLRAVLDLPPEEGARVGPRQGLTDEWDRLLVSIRQMTGFSTFLRPPSADEIREEAAEGPLVFINLAASGSTALVATANSIDAVPLPLLNTEELVKVAVDFVEAAHDCCGSVTARLSGHRRVGEVLAFLWDTIAGPVCEHLGLTGRPQAGRPWPRLWWLPGGPLSFLPLHAAGHHDEHGQPDARCVLDRAVSSYAPTVRALRAARQADRDDLPDPRALVVTMSKTPGQADLPGAEQESGVVSGRFPATTLLAGSAATRANVCAALAEHAAVHFACHGYSHGSDSEANLLLLHDYRTDPLTVRALAGLRLPHARLAFLSACDTARASLAMGDEALHLASAFQLAGFAHVVAALWRVDDLISTRIAERFYESLLDGRPQDRARPDFRRSATALHHAVRQVRERYPHAPGLWAMHVHVGA